MRITSKGFSWLTSIALLVGAMLAASSSAFAQPAPCADLVVTNIAFTPSVPVKDQSATVNITIKNQGACAALGFGVQWKPTLFTPPLGAQVAGLGAGASTTVSFSYIFPISGNLITEAMVDASRTVPETNEFNNSYPQMVTVLRDGIDLVVTGISFSPANPVQGRVAQATITVQNLGLGHADEFVVQWKPTLLAPDLSTQINGLASGASTSVTFNYTYALFGEFTTSAMVDSTHRVLESDEFNNTLNTPVIVEPPRPDLIITSLTIAPAQPVEGLPATVTAVVKNQGNTPAGEFMVQWKPSLLAPDLSKQVNSLDVGASVAMTFDYTYPFAGEFTSFATVDSTWRELELDEDNNTQALVVTVQEATVDLLITSLTIVPSEPTQGLAATVNVMIKNQGNSPSGPFVVEWDPDALHRMSPGPSKLSKQVDDLGPGASLLVTFSFIYQEQGNFLTIARVDARNDVRETDETNNLADLTVTVKPGIDLVITSFTISPNPPVRASTTTASITVRNQGVYPAGAFFVQWKPIKDGLGGPLARVESLNPGQSTTVTLEGSYFRADTFETLAIADVFNQVIESNEGNNTSTRTVTVKPRETRVRVTFNSVHIIEAKEDGCIPIIAPNCDAEWSIVVAVFDANATCSLGGQTVASLQCHQHNDGSVEDGDDLSINKSFDVTLVESTPLVVGTIGLETDDVFGLTTGADFMGYVLQIHPAADRWGEGTHTVTAQEGDPCSACYRVTYTVQILSEPPAFVAGAEAEPPPEFVWLPDGLGRLIPADTALPDGVRRMLTVYLPLVVK